MRKDSIEVQARVKGDRGVVVEWPPPRPSGHRIGLSDGGGGPDRPTNPNHGYASEGKAWDREIKKRLSEGLNGYE